MTAAVLNIALNLALAGLATVLLVGLIRVRRARYHNIRPAEIDADVAAGEDLLRDALSEQQMRLTSVQAASGPLTHSERLR